MAYVPQYGAERGLHDNLTCKQYGNRDQHSCVDGIVSEQADDGARVEQESNQHQREPSDGDGEDYSSAEVPAIGLDEPRRLLRAIEGTSTNQGDFTDRTAVRRNSSLRGCLSGLGHVTFRDSGPGRAGSRRT